MNQYQKEAIAREISFVEDDLARCKRESMLLGNDHGLNDRIKRNLEKLASLRESS